VAPAFSCLRLGARFTSLLAGQVPERLVGRHRVITPDPGASPEMSADSDAAAADNALATVRQIVPESGYVLSDARAVEKERASTR